MNNLINKAQTKKLALAISEVQRPGKFTRVGKSFLDRIESKCRTLIAEEVRAHPTLGKTLL